MTFHLTDFLPYQLNMAAEKTSQSFQAEYKNRFGMLRNEWRVMAQLGAFGPMSATEIAHKAHLHKTKISRAVAALAEKRYLSRSRQDNDRRVELLALTRQGEVVHQALAEAGLRYQAELRARLGAEDLERLSKLLAQLI